MKCLWLLISGAAALSMSCVLHSEPHVKVFSVLLYIQYFVTDAHKETWYFWTISTHSHYFKAQCFLTNAGHQETEIKSKPLFPSPQETTRPAWHSNPCSSRGASAAVVSQRQRQSLSPHFSSFTWISECFGESIFLIWSEQDRRPMFFKEISKEPSAVRLSWSTCSAKSPPRQLFCSSQPLPLWLHRESLAWILYNVFFVLLAVSTERKHAREVSSVLLSSRHPPCTHPQRTSRYHLRRFICIFCCLPEASFSSQQYFPVSLPHFWSEWAANPDPCCLGFSWPSVTSPSKRPVGSIWQQTPFHARFLSDGNSQFPRARWQTVALVVNHMMMHFKFLFKI